MRSVIVILLLSVASLMGQTPVHVRVAGMAQDLKDLESDYGHLQLTVEEVQRENFALRVQIKTMESQIQAIKASQADTLNLVTQQIQTLTTRTQDALDSLAASLSKPAAPQSKPFVFTDDYPKTGVAYVVESGDSLSVIAQKHHSTTRDIQNANRISDPRTLRAGQRIFIPQRQTAQVDGEE